ncbi:phosphatase PAP2 family protein [Myxococcota bacterium]|nr:phosphatase PAP2 family protein [Myxococcota bacterium]
MLTSTRPFALLLAAFTTLGGATAEAAEPSTFHYDPAVSVPITVAAGTTFALMNYVVNDDAVPLGLVSNPPFLDAWVEPRFNQTAHHASDVILYGTIGLGLAASAADGIHDGEGPWVRTGIYLEAFAINGLITDVVKSAQDRPRPFTALDPDTLDAETRAEWEEKRAEADSERSFPSGHASNTAALAFCAARMYDLSGATPAGRAAAYGAAGALTVSVGSLRVAAGRHHPSDVLAGALIGASVGLVVPTLHQRKAVQLSASARSVGFSGTF